MNAHTPPTSALTTWLGHVLIVKGTSMLVSASVFRRPPRRIGAKPSLVVRRTPAALVVGQHRQAAAPSRHEGRSARLKWPAPRLRPLKVACVKTSALALPRARLVDEHDLIAETGTCLLCVETSIRLPARAFRAQADDRRFGLDVDPGDAVEQCIRPPVPGTRVRRASRPAAQFANLKLTERLGHAERSSSRHLVSFGARRHAQ